MPLLAAGLGVLGGVGGAFIGGYVANEGQENRFDKERAAAITDVRRHAYGEFLGAAQEILVNLQTDATDKVKRESFVRFFVAKARVDLVRQNTKVEEAATKVSDALTNDTADDSATAKEQEAAEAAAEAAYVKAAKTFGEVARRAIATGG